MKKKKKKKKNTTHQKSSHHQTQPNETKHNQTQTNTTKHNQTQPNTNKHQPNLTNKYIYINKIKPESPLPCLRSLLRMHGMTPMILLPVLPCLALSPPRGPTPLQRTYRRGILRCSSQGFDQGREAREGRITVIVSLR